jgi:hypothetical protein
MESSAILEAGLLIETIKSQKALAYVETTIEVTKYHIHIYSRKAHYKVLEWVTAWDDAHPETIQCSGDLRCEKNVPGRHKSSCPYTKNWKCTCYLHSGRPLPFIEGVI